MDRRTLAIALVAGAAALGAGACGDDEDNAAGSDAKPQQTLTVAADATYAPNEFLDKDGKTIIGMSADLATALGKAMNARVRLVNAPFDGILPGLAAGKYDLGISSFTDTKEREKSVDFVTYYSAGTSFFVRAKDGPAIRSLADLCGHTIAVQKGTVQADDSAAQAKECKSGGKPALKVLVLPDQPAANLALSSGRADVSMADSPVAAYQVKQAAGRFRLVGEPYGTAPYGIAVPKGSPMTNSVHEAVGTLMRDGTYKAILQKWGLELGAIGTPAINGAVE
jgi:polar amino acid transport system substrate-binding protein